MGSEEFLNRMVEALVIVIDKRPKGGFTKWKTKNIKKIVCVRSFNPSVITFKKSAVIYLSPSIQKPEPFSFKKKNFLKLLSY